MESRCVLQIRYCADSFKIPSPELIPEKLEIADCLVAAIEGGNVADLERHLFSGFYHSFCKFHGVDVASRKPFKPLEPESLLKSSNSLLNKQAMKMFVCQSLYYHLKCSHPAYSASGVQETAAVFVLMLWPHTFTSPDCELDYDGIRRSTILPSFQSVTPSLPLGTIERKKHSLSGSNVSNKELADIFAKLRKDIREHKNKRLSELRDLLTPTLSDLKLVSNPFLSDQLREERRIVDAAAMELVRDKHAELCPCCYLGFKDRADSYLQLFESKRTEKKDREVCDSHIFSGHYLEQTGVLIGADLRQDVVLTTSTKSMTVPLLCNYCDNKQGMWENLIAKREACCATERCSLDPHYCEPAYAQWGFLHRETHLGHGNELEYKSQRSLFRFYVPCIYRSLLLDVDTSTDSNASWQICDALRQYLHRHLYCDEPDRNDLRPVFIYALGVYIGNMRPLLKRFRLNNIPDEEHGELLNASCYTTSCLSDSTVVVAALVTPYVVLVSKVQLASLSAFWIQDCASPVVLPFPDERCHEALDHIALVYVRYYRSRKQLFLSDNNRNLVDRTLSATEGQLPESDVFQFLLRASAVVCYLRLEKCTGGHMVSTFGEGFAKVAGSKEELLSGRTVTLMREADSAELRMSIKRHLQAFDVGQELAAFFASVDEVYLMFTVLLCWLKAVPK